MLDTMSMNAAEDIKGMMQRAQSAWRKCLCCVHYVMLTILPTTAFECNAAASCSLQCQSGNRVDTYFLFSHLGLMRYLTLVVRVSTQHHS
jgi:hypothetical protein